MNFMSLWHDGKCRSRVLLITIPTPGCDLGVKVAHSEFSYKGQNVCI